MSAYPPEKAGQPGQQALPTRGTNETSGYASDDDAVPEVDSNDAVSVLSERLQAWKHACGYLENYISATEKMQKAHAKEYEKVLKTINEPLKEGHHFDQSLGGIAGLFENMRTNTKGIANSHLETSKNLGGSVLPILTRLHQEIKNKSKEMNSGAGKGAKAVSSSRNSTQKHIELLGQHTAGFDSAGHKAEAQNDPYVLKRGTLHRLHKQVVEENNSRNDIIAVQKNFEAFEAHVIQVMQQPFGAFLQQVGGQADRQKNMYTDMVGTAQKIPPEFEWMNFLSRSSHVLVDPDAPLREVKHIKYANEDHASTKPLIAGTLERKSRAMGGIGGYKTAYYAVTPSKFLHQFESDDNFKKDPTPELSLYLPDCTVGKLADTKFNVKGKDASKGKVGSAFQMQHELSFKAHTSSDAAQWYRIITDCLGGAGMTSPVSPVTSANSPSDAKPPSYEQPAPLQTSNLPQDQSQASAGVTSAGTAPGSAAPGSATTPASATAAGTQPQ